MADREDGPPGSGFDAERAGDVTEHRVARLADLGSAAPSAVASLRDIGASAEQAAVVDLREWRRGGGRGTAPAVDPTVGPAVEPTVDYRARTRVGSGVLTDPPATSQTPGALRSDDTLCEEREDHELGRESRRSEEPGGRGARRDRRRRGRSGGGDGDGEGARAGRGEARGRARGAQVELGSDPVAIAREICLRLLTDRARTRGELADALRRRGVPDDAAEMVLARFDEVGLIDDAAFAGQWVRSRHRHRGLARRAIAVELRRKGVADDVAQDALAEVDSASEEQRARELVDRKLRTIAADTPEQRTSAARRLVGMLARRGYPGGIAYSVVRAALADHGADDDELGADSDL